MLHFNESWARGSGEEDAVGTGPDVDVDDGSGTGTDGVGAETWKVLIYDLVGRDVISPLLKVKDLREHAVTLHMCVPAAPVRERDASIVGTHAYIYQGGVTQRAAHTCVCTVRSCTDTHGRPRMCLCLCSCISPLSLSVRGRLGCCMRTASRCPTSRPFTLWSPRRTTLTALPRHGLIMAVGERECEGEYVSLCVCLCE
jgi:hypothetical protein